MQEKVWSSAAGNVSFFFHLFVCCSHHGSPSNLLHRSDGFIEVPAKSIQKITM